MGCLSLFRKENLKWLSVLATIIMTFVQLGGALVTKTGSEDGCGSSWPLCNGAFLPQNLPIQTIIELSHRAVSALSLIVVLWLVITAWKHIGYIKEIKPLSIISVGFLLLQALVGAAAVVWQQNDYVLALHFGISLVSFSSVFLMTLIVFSIDQKYEADEVMIKKPLRTLTWLMAIIVYLTIYTGALVRHTDSRSVGSSPMSSSISAKSKPHVLNSLSMLAILNAAVSSAGAVIAFTAAFLSRVFASLFNFQVKNIPTQTIVSTSR